MKQSVILSKVIVGVVGALLGMLIVLGLRFVSYKPPLKTHYHANFAVYINGQQEQFDNALLYEETLMCSLETSITPEKRAHLHDNVKDVVHVEDEAVTWGHLFQNIGWGVGKNYLSTSDELLKDDDNNKVSYILNGKPVDDISSVVIGNTDRLLISYGTSTADQLSQQFAAVAATAKEHNLEEDPSSCGAGHDEPTIQDRLKHIF